jgi:hypothetical protein
MDPPLRSRVLNGNIQHRQPTKVQNSTVIRKSDVFFFWDSQGPILEHYQERGATVNSAHYSETLRDKLTPAIRTKRRGLLSKGVALLHDNTRPHTAAHTVETLRHLNSEVLEYPPYSPDLAPSDCH